MIKGEYVMNSKRCFVVTLITILVPVNLANTAVVESTS
jgi:hypothetical protein